MATATVVGNKLSRILIVCLLIIPAPVYAENATVTENFDDQELNQDITFLYGASDSIVSNKAKDDVMMTSLVDDKFEKIIKDLKQIKSAVLKKRVL